MATIFLIDDDSSIVTLFEKFLTILGHEIVAKAYNGEEAVKLFNEFRKMPDLILMDHRMPKKDGLTLAIEILKVKLVINRQEFLLLYIALLLDSDWNIIYTFLW